MKTGEFHNVASKLLAEKLKPLTSGVRSLNGATCVEIYTTIFNAFVEIMVETGAKLTNEAVNYLAQQYYDAVRVNGTQELDPMIFNQRAKTENISTKELVLLSGLLSGTDFVLPVIAEIKKRS